MITKVSIKDIATYDNTGMIIDNLSKINFIYGANGTGKTTISTYLNNLKDKKYNSCEVKWQNEPIDILVYNKKFKDENYMEKLKGIYTFGNERKYTIYKDKNETLVELTLPKDSQIFASKYQIVLPNKEELKKLLETKESDFKE